MKVLEKYLTRDVPVILIEAWYQSRVRNFKEFFYISFPKTIFISSKGVFQFYIDLTDFDCRFPKKLAVWSRVRENVKKLHLVRQFMKVGLYYFKQIKNKNASLSELINYLSKTKKLLANGYAGVLVTHHFPRWDDLFRRNGERLFHPKMIKEIMLWREDEGNIFMNEGSDTIYSMLKKIARKKKWNSDLLKYITLKELIVAVKKGVLPLVQLKKRQNSRFAFLDGRIVFGPELDKELKNIRLQLKDRMAYEKSYLKGSVANRGYAKGRVRVIFRREDLSIIKRGDILIAPMTTPWYLPAVKKVSAIVTDEGGISSHAAIISREFQIPCIIGTKIATQILKDGDLVEVDATRGIVRRLADK